MKDSVRSLRAFAFRSLAGCGVAWLICTIFSDRLFNILFLAPAREALLYAPPSSDNINPWAWLTIWLWTPLLTAVFLSSPWLMYQVWSYVSRARRWCVPFVLCTSGVFIAGGLLGRVLIVPRAVPLLLNPANGVPVVSLDRYFAALAGTMLGTGLALEMPVLIFFLTLIGAPVMPSLLKRWRYVILAILIIAAAVTPTPDVLNLLLFAGIIGALFLFGLLAGNAVSQRIS